MLFKLSNATIFRSTKRSNIWKKAMEFCLLLEIWEKNFGKNISKSLSSKYSQKLLVHAKQSATDALKTASNRAI